MQAHGELAGLPLDDVLQHVGTKTFLERKFQPSIFQFSHAKPSNTHSNITLHVALFAPAQPPNYHQCLAIVGLSHGRVNNPCLCREAYSRPA